MCILLHVFHVPDIKIKDTFVCFLFTRIGPTRIVYPSVKHILEDNYFKLGENIVLDQLFCY